MKILLATTNQKKIREYNNLFQDLDIEFITLKDLNCEIESPEDHETFAENALQKAQFYYDIFKLPTISDDSGIEVYELNNFPGVYSKRFMENSSYSDKVEELLKRLDGKDSSCQYHAVIAYVDGNTHKTFDGIFKGKLVAPDKNNQDAFGYDVGFFVEEKNALVSDLPLEYKNGVSHRSKALNAFVEWIKTRG